MSWVVSPSTNPKLEDHPLLAVRDYLLIMFATTLRKWRPDVPSAMDHVLNGETLLTRNYFSMYSDNGKLYLISSLQIFGSTREILYNARSFIIKY
jgi:hypothetical protein